MKRIALAILYVILLWWTGCSPDEPRWVRVPDQAMVDRVWVDILKMSAPAPVVTFIDAKGCAGPDGYWYADAFLAGADGCVEGIYNDAEHTALVSKVTAWDTVPHELIHAMKAKRAGDPDAGHGGWTDPNEIAAFWERPWRGPAEDLMVKMLSGN